MDEQERNFQEHRVITDKLEGVIVEVAKQSVVIEQIADSIVGLAKNVDSICEGINQDKRDTKKWFLSIAKYVVIGLLSGTIGAGSISAFTHPQSPTEQSPNPIEQPK